MKFPITLEKRKGVICEILVDNKIYKKGKKSDTFKMFMRVYEHGEGPDVGDNQMLLTEKWSSLYYAKRLHKEKLDSIKLSEKYYGKDITREITKYIPYLLSYSVADCNVEEDVEYINKHYAKFRAEYRKKTRIHFEKELNNNIKNLINKGNDLSDQLSTSTHANTVEVFRMK